MKLQSICSKWLKKNFNLNVRIIGVRIIGQREIDKILNLVMVKIDFIDDKGLEGDTVALMDMDMIDKKIDISAYGGLEESLATN